MGCLLLVTYRLFELLNMSRRFEVQMQLLNKAIEQFILQGANQPAHSSRHAVRTILCVSHTSNSHELAVQSNVLRSIHWRCSHRSGRFPLCYWLPLPKMTLSFDYAVCQLASYCQQPLHCYDIGNTIHSLHHSSAEQTGEFVMMSFESKFAVAEIEIIRSLSQEIGS